MKTTADAFIRETGLAAMLGGALWMVLCPAVYPAAVLADPWRHWPVGPLDDVLFGVTPGQ